MPGSSDAHPENSTRAAWSLWPSLLSPKWVAMRQLPLSIVIMAPHARGHNSACALVQHLSRGRKVLEVALLWGVAASSQGAGVGHGGGSFRTCLLIILLPCASTFVSALSFMPAHICSTQALPGHDQAVGCIRQG